MPPLFGLILLLPSCVGFFKMNSSFLLQITQAILGIVAIILILIRVPVADENNTNWFAPQLSLRGWDKIMFLGTIFVLLAFTFVSIARLVWG